MVDAEICKHFRIMYRSRPVALNIHEVPFTVEPRLTVTSLIRSPRYYGQFLFAAKQSGHTFSCKKPSLIRPNVFGPLATVLTGFHCTITYALNVEGEILLVTKLIGRYVPSIQPHAWVIPNLISNSETLLRISSVSVGKCKYFSPNIMLIVSHTECMTLSVCALMRCTDEYQRQLLSSTENPWL